MFTVTIATEYRSLPLTGTSAVNRWNMLTGVPPWPVLKD